MIHKLSHFKLYYSCQVIVNKISQIKLNVLFIRIDENSTPKNTK